MGIWPIKGVLKMVIAPAQPQHWGHIYANLIKSLREQSTHVEGMSGREIGQLLTNLVGKGWTVQVAELEGVIAGWVISGPEKQQCGWVFVRADLGFTGQGLAKLLLETVGINMSLPVYSPFVPNRSRNCPLRLKIRHRPFLCVARPANAQ